MGHSSGHEGSSAALLLWPGPLQVGVKVLRAGCSTLKLSCHDSFRSVAFKVIDEAEARRSGRTLRKEQCGMRVRRADGVVDDMSFTVEIESKERCVMDGEAVGVGKDRELIVVPAVEILRPFEVICLDHTREGMPREIAVEGIGSRYLRTR